MATFTFRCLKESCGHLFDTQKVDGGKCPKCRTKRLQWVPVRIAVRSVASGIDRDLRQGAEAFGLSNLNSARLGERTKPSVHEPAGARPIPYKVQGAGNGWGGAVWADSSGRIVEKSMCAPAGVTSRVSAEVGRRSPAGGPGPASLTSYVAKHNPRP